MDAPPPSPAPPRRRILLHACCGPCSTHCVRELRASGVEPVLFYSNSNIDTEEEFAKRLAALRAFAAAEGVEVVADAYDPASWERAVAGLEAEPEGVSGLQTAFQRLGGVRQMAAARLMGGEQAVERAERLLPVRVGFVDLREIPAGFRGEFTAEFRGVRL